MALEIKILEIIKTELLNFYLWLEKLKLPRVSNFKITEQSNFSFEFCLFELIKSLGKTIEGKAFEQKLAEGFKLSYMI
ncbi:hypothetical protein BpHYR1_036508 [Brachionus plicatilis]|uniref:Uncharacterized protein n=1 Tax=Brachionus plicatilis TaxID=10195 RepID=A0A3M7RNL8_BRAPC|nr:hypothetical protein BpHYR1_036508 [Brachionus plicatilis]